MSSLFDKPKQYTPPSRTDAEVQAAAEAERKRRAAMAGRSALILTGQTGVSNTSGAGKQTLGQ